MENSLLASAGRALWRLFEARNLDAGVVFRHAGLDPALVSQSQARYPYDRLCAAWVEAATLLDSPNIGLEAAEYFTPLDLNALGVTFLSSQNLIEALQRLDRYEELLNSSLDFTIELNDDRLVLSSVIESVPEDAARIVEDCRSAVILKLTRIGLNHSVDPVEVAFTYPKPRATGDYFGIFRCPVLFSQPVTSLSFSITDARRPFTDANRELALSNDRFLDGMLKNLKNAGIISQVKRAIIDALPSGTPSEEDIANTVFVSGRTLQRRLSDENTNFRTLVMEVRRELAEKYISDRDMPLAEISYMLGFADTSSFSRAFKQWTGEPPALFRKSL